MQNLLLSWASWVSCRHPCFKNLTSFPNFSWFCPSDLTNNTWVLNRRTGIWPPKNVTLLRPTQPAKATRYGMIFRIWRSNYIHINFPKNPMFCSLVTYLTMCSFHWFKHFFAPEKISRCATLPVIQPEIPDHLPSSGHLPALCWPKSAQPEGQGTHGGPDPWCYGWEIPPEMGRFKGTSLDNITYNSNAGWWLTYPSWKIWIRQLGRILPDSMENKTCLKPPTRLWIIYIWGNCKILRCLITKGSSNESLAMLVLWIEPLGPVLHT